MTKTKTPKQKQGFSDSQAQFLKDEQKEEDREEAHKQDMVLPTDISETKQNALADILRKRFQDLNPEEDDYESDESDNSWTSED